MIFQASSLALEASDLDSDLNESLLNAPPHTHTELLHQINTATRHSLSWWAGCFWPWTHKCFPRVRMPAADNWVQHIHCFVCVYSWCTIPQSWRPSLFLPSGRLTSACLSLSIFGKTSNVDTYRIPIHFTQINANQWPNCAVNKRVSSHH